MANKSFILRIEIENGQAVIRGLDATGDAGDKAGRRIKQAFDAEATPAMRAYNQVVEEGGRAIQGYAGRLGPLGNILSSMGAKGLVIAAGIGAVTAATVALSSHVQQFVGDMDDIQDAADRLKISAEAIQALRLSARDLGFDASEADQAIQKIRDLRLQAMSGVRGSEKAMGLFSALGIRDDELRNLESTEDLLARIGKAAAGMGDEGQAAGILLKAGIDSVAVALIEAGGNIDAITSKFKESGQVFDASLVKSAADLQQRWDEMETKIGVGVGNAFLQLAETATPPLEKIAGLMSVIINGAALLDRLGLGGTMLNMAGGLGNIAAIIEAAQNDDGGVTATVERSAVQNVLIALRQMRPPAPGTLSRFSADDLPKGDFDVDRGAVEDARARDRAADAAAKEAEAFAKLEEARRAWRDDPIIKAEDLAALERAGVNVGKSITAVMDAFAKEFDKSFQDRERVVDFFAQPLAMAIRSGNVIDAAEGLADAFANALSRRLAEGLLDAVIPQGGGWLGNFLGGGDLFSWGGGNSVASSVGSAVLSGSRASGGPVWPGTWLVGERGPELLHMGSAGHISNNAATMAALQHSRSPAAASARPPIVNIQINNESGTPIAQETHQSTDAMGNANVMVTLRKLVREEVKATVASGEADRALKTRSGISPALRSRA